MVNNRLMTEGHSSKVEHIFRSYDIRGIYGKDLNEHVMIDIGKTFGTFIAGKEAVIARDVRLSSPKLNDAFVSGFLTTGKNIEDIGVLPLGAAMFHAWQNKKDIAYITASHLPKEWNGVKFFHGNGLGFVEKENLAVKEIFMKEKFMKSKLLGKKSRYEAANVIDEYQKHLISRIKPAKKLKIVLDCGNGCAALVAPLLFKEAGFGVKVLYKEPDGTFPNRLPDPIDSELFVLKEAAKEEDIGIGYDGDGDRMALVDETGALLSVEETSYIILSELLKTENSMTTEGRQLTRGPIIANVECTRVIDKIAEKFGRKVIRVPVGHTFLMEASHKNHAAFGVERSGHFAMPFLFPFDDSLAISYYVACVISKRDEKLSEIVKEIPKSIFERMTYACPDDKKFQIIESLEKKLMKEYKNANTMDGVRVDLDNGWVLFRVSNTAPAVRMTLEADTQKDFESLKTEFLKILEKEMRKFGLGLIVEKK